MTENELWIAIQDIQAKYNNDADESETKEYLDLFKRANPEQEKTS